MWRAASAAALGILVALGLDACSGPGAAAGAGSVGSGEVRSAAAHGAAGRGGVTVLYAGSLADLMERTVGPRFSARTGYGFSGVAGGSQELANEVRAGIRGGDVFVSASPTADATLMGAAHGAWVSWDAMFARSPLVLGFEPHSPVATALRSHRWTSVVTAPGVAVGRTDPALDPKGALTVASLRAAATATGDRRLLDMAAARSTIFPEQTLLGRLETGQLDAAFLYRSEALAAGVPFVGLGSAERWATYTVTVLARAPHPGAARAFVSFLLGPGARGALVGVGLETIDPPVIEGRDAPHWVSAARGGR